MPTLDAEPSAEKPELKALARVIRSFQRVVESYEGAEDRVQAEIYLELARDLYVPVRELAEQIRLTHGEVPSVRAAIAELDEILN